jgi:hypothetical protein
VYGASNFGECIFGPHRATPDLSIVEEEKLIMSEIKARQSGLFAMN